MGRDGLERHHATLDDVGGKIAADAHHRAAAHQIEPQGCAKRIDPPDAEAPDQGGAFVGVGENLEHRASAAKFGKGNHPPQLVGARLFPRHVTLPRQ